MRSALARPGQVVQSGRRQRSAGRPTEFHHPGLFRDARSKSSRFEPDFGAALAETSHGTAGAVATGSLVSGRSQPARQRRIRGERARAAVTGSRHLGDGILAQLF